MTDRPREVLLATRSAGKLRELGPLLAEAGYVPVDLATLGIPELPEEDMVEAHDSFEANAIAKARYFTRWSEGRAVLADDSGLVVDALGGAPGVRSKRWSGRSDLSGRALDAANNERLIAELSALPAAPRSARYVCAAAWAAGDHEIVQRGEVEGEIVLLPRGAEGFGYDPYFLSSELRRTFGESSREEKARVSHRARAVRALLAAVRSFDAPRSDEAGGADASG